MEKSGAYKSLTSSPVFRLITVGACMLIGVLSLFLLDEINPFGGGFLSGNFLQKLHSDIGATSFNVYNSSWYVTLIIVIFVLFLLFYKVFKKDKPKSLIKDFTVALIALLILLVLLFLSVLLNLLPFQKWSVLNIITSVGYVYVVTCIDLGVTYLVTFIITKIKSGKREDLSSEEFPSDAMDTL